ncbi:MAG TPA: rhombosortase [Gammaproteobacteria bacterium]|nr:rhombosortase [Gammaproteobacteria bacterium]
MSRWLAMRRTLFRAWPLGLVIVICVALQAGGAAPRLALRYQREAIAAGQWWRLFTGNFVHVGWTHLWLDLVGLLLLWILVGARLSGWRWLFATIAGGWAIGLGLWWAWPAVDWYVGISGIAHTYWAAGALLLLARREWEGWVLLALLGGKLAWEQASGTGLPTSDLLLHAPILTAAHLIGAIAGVAVAAALLLARLRRLRGDAAGLGS